MRPGYFAVDPVEVVEHDVEDAARAGETALAQRDVEAVEVQLRRICRPAVVLTQPLDQFPVGVESSKAGTEPFLHGRISRLPGAEDVLVDRASLRGRHLYDHGAVAVSRHESLEEPVPDKEDLLAAVQRLSEAE